MKRIIIILAVIAASFTAHAQTAWDGVEAGPYLLFVPCDTCATVAIRLDTMLLKQPTAVLFRYIDSLATANGWGGGGSATFVKDKGIAYPVVDSSSPGLYILKYQIFDAVAYHGTAVFSPDSVRISFDNGYMISPPSGYGLAGFSFLTSSGGLLQSNFFGDLPPSVGTDSAYVAHFTKRSTSYYLSIYKYETSTTTVPWQPPITSGVCIKEVLISPTYIPGGVISIWVQFYFVSRRYS